MNQVDNLCMLSSIDSIRKSEVRFEISIFYEKDCESSVLALILILFHVLFIMDVMAGD